jgi:cytochrome P450
LTQQLQTLAAIGRTFFKLVATLWVMRRAGRCRAHLAWRDLQRIWGDQFRLPVGPCGATVFADPESVREVFAQPVDVLSATRSRKLLVGLLPPKAMTYLPPDRHAIARPVVAKCFGMASNRVRPERLIEALKERLVSGRPVGGLQRRRR